MKDKHAFVRILWRLVLAFPLLVLIGEIISEHRWLGRDPIQAMYVEPDIRFVRLAIAAAPYLVLALFAQWRLRAYPSPKVLGGVIGAAVAVVVSSVFVWGIYFNDFGRGGGVNFAVAFLVIFSPFFTPILMLLGYALGRLLPKGIPRAAPRSS